MDDVYRTIAAPSRFELKERGSRFIAESFVVASEDEANRLIEAIRKQTYTATHHCTAWRLGVDAGSFRYNDDGEPAGTAGAPMLRQIDARELTQTLVVVTRYFGGTKLGTGGLIRAYGDAAAAVLDASGILEHVVRERLNIRFAYTDTSPALHVVGLFDTEVVDTKYGDDTEMLVAVRRSQVSAFRDAYVEALSGRGGIYACIESTENDAI